MQKLLAGIIIFIAVTSPLHASNVKTFGKNSPVVFPHKQHQEILGGCTECHGAKDPGPIEQFGEKWAHTTCKGCHSENKTGPVECSGCHTEL